MKKRLKSLGLILLVASLMVVPVHAEPNVNSLQNQKDKIQNEINKLEKELEEVWTNMYDTEAKLVAKGEEILQATAELQEAEEMEVEQYEAMKKRIVVMYESGNTSMIQMILESKSFADMLRNAENVNTIHEYDRKQLQVYVETKEKIANLKETLEAEADVLEELRNEFAKQKAGLDKVIAEKENQVASLDSQIQEALRKAQEEAARKAAEEAARKEQERLEKEQQNNNNSGGSSNNNSSSTTKPNKPSNDYVSTGDASVGQAIVNAAYSYIGTPYVWGGNGYGGIDCSGLTKAAHNAVGIYSIARTSGAQAGGGKDVGSLANALPGDVICYPGHVAIYIGNNQVIHAPTFGQTVKVANVSMGPSQPITAIRRYW